MTAAEWAGLTTAVVGLLTAITALVRLELAQRRAGVAPKHAAVDRHTDDQSCSGRNP